MTKTNKKSYKNNSDLTRSMHKLCTKPKISQIIYSETAII